MKLVNLVPGKQVNVKESLDDLDTSLPQSVERYLEKMVSQIKGMNLNRKKEIIRTVMGDGIIENTGDIVEEILNLINNKR